MASEADLKKLARAAQRARQSADRANQALSGLSEGTERHTSALNDQLQKSLAAREAMAAYAVNAGESEATIAALKDSVLNANIALNKQIEANKAASEAIAAYNAQAAAGHTATMTLAGSIGLMGDAWKTAGTSAIFSAGGLRGIGKAFKEIASPMNVAGSSLNALVEGTISLTLAADDASVLFNKMTGMVGQFEDQIRSTELQLRSMGVGVGDLYKNMTMLATEVGTFTDMSETSQNSMLKGVSVMEKFGISAEETTGNINTMMASMGLTGEEAVKLQQSLMLTAMENNIATNKMMSDFANSADELAAFGDRGVEVFGDLAMAAKKSNMEVGDLLNVALKFDTFEGATESVGKLNALLGGPFLNSLDMVMTTDPTERLSMIQGALNSTGKSFQDMSYYERKAIADAAGLASTADLAKVMSGEFDGLAGSIGKSEEELAAMEKTSTDFNTLFEEAKQTLMMFAVELKPVIDFAKDLLQKIQDMSPAMKKFVLGFSIALIVLPALGAIVGGLVLGLLSLAAIVAVVAIAFLTSDKWLPPLKKFGLYAMTMLSELMDAMMGMMGGTEGLGQAMAGLKDVDIGATLNTQGLEGVAKELGGLIPSEAMFSLKSAMAAPETMFDSKPAVEETNALRKFAREQFLAVTGYNPKEVLPGMKFKKEGVKALADPVVLKTVIMVGKRKLAEAIGESEVMGALRGATGGGLGIR